jgi:hypothetical protein
MASHKRLRATRKASARAVPQRRQPRAFPFGNVALRRVCFIHQSGRCRHRTAMYPRLSSSRANRLRNAVHLTTSFG